MKRKSLLFLQLFALFAPWTANAQKALPYTYGFEDNDLSIDGWTLQTSSSSTGIIEYDGAAHSGSFGFAFAYDDQSGYLISPLLTGTENGVDLSFYYKEYSDTYGDEQFYVGYTTDETVTDPSEFRYDDNIVTASLSWAEYLASFPEGTKRIAIKYVYNNAYFLFLDDFSFTATPSCPAPTNLTVTNLAAYSATLNWTSEASNFNVRYRTAEHRETLYFDDFNNSQVLSSWWSSNSVIYGLVYFTQGDNLAMLGYEEDATHYLITGELPEFENGSTVEFYQRLYNYQSQATSISFQVGYSTTTDDLDAFTYGGAVTVTSTSLSLYSEVIPSGAKYIAIKTTGGEDYGLLVDNFGIYGPTTAAGSWIPATANATTLDITGLSEETDYEWQVQAVCGDGSSEWSRMATFHTPSNCEAPANLTATDIDAYSATLNWTGIQGSYNVRYRTAEHRETLYFDDFNNSQVLSSWWSSNSVIYGLVYFTQGDNLAMLGYEEDATHYLITGELPEFENGSTVEFYQRLYNYQSQATSISFQVGYSTTTDDLDAFTYGGAVTVTSTSLSLYSEVIPSGAKYIAIKATGGEDYGLLVDNFGIYGPTTAAGSWIPAAANATTLNITGLNPKTEYEWQVQGINASCDGGVTEWSASAFFTTEVSCLVPTELDYRLNDNTAVLVWTSDATLFDIEVNGEVIEGVENPYNFEVEPETIYEVRVRANCGNGDYSNWTDYIDFVTSCGGAKDLPYEFGFDIADMGEYYACWLATSWSSANNVSLAYDPDDETNIVFRFSSWNYDDDDTYTQILISPELNTEAAVNVQFDYMPYTTNYGNETFTVGYASDFSSLSDFEWAYDIEADDATQWTTFSKNLPAGTKYVAILYTSEYVSHLFLDNFSFTESTGVTLPIALTAGWNWISLPIEVEDPIATLQALEEALGENGMHIESDGLGTENLGGFWVGDLDEVGLTNEQMFLIEVSTDCTIELQGAPVNPANHEITINNGWNWIGFPCTQELPINEAMAGFEAEDEDLIEGQDDQAVYFFGEWVGLETLVPGQGYLYYSNSNEPKTLIIQTGAKARHTLPTLEKFIMQPIKTKVMDNNHVTKTTKSNSLNIK